MTNTSIDSKTTKELKTIAKDLGIKGYTKLSKDELVEAVGQAAQKDVRPTVIDNLVVTVEDRAQELAEETLKHGSVKDKSPGGVAYRVAVRLNKEGFKPGTGGRNIYTTKLVLAILYPEPVAVEEVVEETVEVQEDDNLAVDTEAEVKADPIEYDDLDAVDVVSSDTTGEEDCEAVAV